MNRCDKVCLTVWNQGFKKEGHWEWNPTSVVVFGNVKPVTENNIFEDRLANSSTKNNIQASEGMLKHWYRTGNYDVAVFEWEYLEMISHWEMVYGKGTENDRKHL